MLYFLSEHTDGLAFLRSIYLRGFLSFVLSFILLYLLGKPFINYLRRNQLSEKIRDDGPKSHNSKSGTPTMGGALIIFSVIITTLLISDVTNEFIILLIVSTLLFAAIGFVDDYRKLKVNKKGLSGRKKLLWQALIALLIWIFIVNVGITGDRRIDLALINPISKSSYIRFGRFFMLFIVTFIILGSSNAVNITDGLDGLVMMPTIICYGILGAIAYFTGHKDLSDFLKLYYTPGIGEITIYMCAVCGAGLAFLWYNFYPAEIFMGDTGSLTLGGMLGVISILLKQELLLPIIGFIFVLEALSVILQVGSFKFRGKRIFKMAPIHHHFELVGLAETKVTMRFWISTLLCGILALGLIRLRGFM